MNIEKLSALILSASDDDYTSAVRLMINLLSVMTVRLPDIGISGLEVAKQYWMLESVPQSIVEQTRVDCWNFLDTQPAEERTDEVENALRAVICVLYTSNPGDLGELIDFFISMLRGAFHGNDDEFLKKVISLLPAYDS